MPMTSKTILALLMLILPVLSWAECGMDMTGATLTIVVGKSKDKCFSSGFSETFKATVNEALEEEVEPVAVSRKRAFDERNARGRKLWSIAERQHQAGPGGRYFGQK